MEQEIISKAKELLKNADTGTNDCKHYNNGFIDGVEYAIKALHKHAVSGSTSHKINTMAERTKLTFQMINFDDDYIVDPNSIFINGWLPNWQMLDEFLFKKEDSNLPELIDDMKSGKMYQVELEIWVDSDDYRHWIDFKVLDSGLV